MFCGIILFLSGRGLAFAADNFAGPDIRLVYNRMLLNPPEGPYISNGEVYVPLRYICEQLGLSVSWDGRFERATVSRNGHAVNLRGPIVNEKMMVSLSALDEFYDALGVRVDYFPDIGAVSFNDSGSHTTKKQLLAVLPTYNSYTYDDLYWLAKIVEAEAKGESYNSKLAVANVVINRTNSEMYPNSIKEVIFDKRHGVQFSPTANGSINKPSGDESYIAALDALEGRNNASTALFFFDPKYATSKWIEKNRQYAFTIGGHQYYF